MTTQAVPDPTSLKSWEEVFQYPLPTVRKLSVRLRKDIDDHRNRLRSVVGASYRDLLGTAERIIDMNGQIQTVEVGLGDIGRRCNSRLLERGDSNYNKFEQDWDTERGSEQRLSWAARSRILTASLATVERLVKRNGNTLQAAKLMVLSRLLYKSLEIEDGEHASLHRQRRRISLLRNRLLTHIDRVLSKSSLTPETTIATLSAFALLSSSKLRDVLGHFLAVRVAQLENLSQTPTSEVMLEALTLYTESIRLVHTVFPRSIMDSLASLGKTALLNDDHVKRVTELNLDIYGRWVAEDIRGFRPWVQQEVFPGEEARKDVASFSTRSRAVLSNLLQQCLQGSSNFVEVLSIRKQVLGAYLSVGTQSEIDGFLDHVEEMRASFTSQLGVLIERAVQLDNFRPSHESKPASHSQSLWSLADDDFDLSSGGINLRQAILRKRHGHDERFEITIKPLREWLERVQSFSKALGTMGATRWEEYFELDVEDGEEDVARVFQAKLSVDDPAKLEDLLRSVVNRALANALMRLEEEVDTAQPEFLIRLLRSLNRHVSIARATVKAQEDPMSAQDGLVRRLHLSLARAVSQDSLAALNSSLECEQHIAADLWEGIPRLPLQTLPSIFRFVISLQRDMALHNEDIWSNAAVEALRAHVRETLATSLLAKPGPQANGADGHPKPSTEGQNTDSIGEVSESAPATAEQSVVTENDTIEGKEPQSSSTNEAGDGAGHQHARPPSSVVEGEQQQQSQHEQHVQRLFDAHYLSSVFGAYTPDPALVSTISSLRERSSLDSGALQRLEKNAIEYWRRTYLLFGLLAQSGSSAAKR